MGFWDWVTGKSEADTLKDSLTKLEREVESFELLGKSPGMLRLRVEEARIAYLDAKIIEVGKDFLGGPAQVVDARRELRVELEASKARAARLRGTTRELESTGGAQKVTLTQSEGSILADISKENLKSLGMGFESRDVILALESFISTRPYGGVRDAGGQRIAGVAEECSRVIQGVVPQPNQENVQKLALYTSLRLVKAVRSDGDRYSIPKIDTELYFGEDALQVAMVWGPFAKEYPVGYGEELQEILSRGMRMVEARAVRDEMTLSDQMLIAKEFLTSNMGLLFYQGSEKVTEALAQSMVKLHKHGLDTDFGRRRVVLLNSKAHTDALNLLTYEDKYTAVNKGYGSALFPTSEDGTKVYLPFEFNEEVDRPHVSFIERTAEELQTYMLELSINPYKDPPVLFEDTETIQAEAEWRMDSHMDRDVLGTIMDMFSSANEEYVPGEGLVAVIDLPAARELLTKRIHDTGYIAQINSLREALVSRTEEYRSDLEGTLEVLDLGKIEQIFATVKSASTTEEYA